MGNALEHGWMVDHVDDIASDLSVLHRVDDWESMPAHRYFSLASRLVHYQGVIRDKAMMEVHKAESPELPAVLDPTMAQARPEFAGDGANFPPVFEMG